MNPKIYYPVGRRSHDTRSIIANWEAGRCDVPAYCLQLIAYSLGAKIADILPDLTFNELIDGQIMHRSGRIVRQRQPVCPSVIADV